MREIKFRGKSIETGEMIYGSLINNMFFKTNTKEPVIYIVDPDQFDDYDSFEDIEHLAVEVDPETIGQYTGLKERNGKEIYEGDIIRWHDIVTADYSITFTDGVFCLNGSADENLYHHREEIGSKWEVIGNIYTNPELLGR